MKRPGIGVLVGIGLLVAVVVGGFASIYASGDPDGLNKVAADEGMAAQEQAHDLEDGPFAGYESPVEGDLSGGVAAVVGIATTFALAAGLFLVVRRRREPAGTGQPAGQPKPGGR